MSDWSLTERPRRGPDFGTLYRRHPARPEKLEYLLQEHLHKLEYPFTDTAEVISGNGRVSGDGRAYGTCIADTPLPYSCIGSNPVNLTGVSCKGTWFNRFDFDFDSRHH